MKDENWEKCSFQTFLDRWKVIKIFFKVKHAMKHGFTNMIPKLKKQSMQWKTPESLKMKNTIEQVKTTRKGNVNHIF